MLKRIGLFLLTNLLVIATISIVMNLLGIHGYLTQHGIDYRALLIFCVIWGMVGSGISLLLSKWMAKTQLGVKLIDSQSATGDSAWLIQTVHRLAQRAGVQKMPEVGIYDSPEFNAFATGPSKNHSLVAVSSGLLQSMSHDEIEGVLAHEITHVGNGDMVTMMLIQGVVNAFAMFLSRIVAYAISTAMSRDENGEGMSYMTFYILTFVFDILFTILGSLVTAAFSRWREYRADAGGARLAGRDKMINALQRLKAGIEITDPRAPALSTLKISGLNKGIGIIALFASHPPLDERIARLQKGQY